MHEPLVWFTASSRVSELQNRIGLQIRWKVLFCAQRGWTVSQTTNQKRIVVKVLSPYWGLPGNKVVYTRTLNRRNPSRFHGRAQNSWDQSAAFFLSKGALRHMKTLERECPSQDVIQHTGSHGRSTNAQNLRTGLKNRLWNKRDAPAETRGTCKSVHKLKEKEKATFFSPSDVWCPPAPSSTRPEEGEFVVDSGASMNMLSREDLNSGELETVRVSRNATTVFTANGAVQTKEEATAYVKDLDLFVTAQILEDTSAVVKLCEDHR